MDAGVSGNYVAALCEDHCLTTGLTRCAEVLARRSSLQFDWRTYLTVDQHCCKAACKV